jgi:hypothetical protein
MVMVGISGSGEQRITNDEQRIQDAESNGTAFGSSVLGERV